MLNILSLVLYVYHFSVAGLSQLAYRELVSGVHSRLASLPGGFGPGLGAGFPLGVDATTLTRGFPPALGSGLAANFGHGLAAGLPVSLPGNERNVRDMARDIAASVPSALYGRDKNSNRPSRSVDERHRGLDDRLRGIDESQRRLEERPRPMNERPRGLDDRHRSMEVETQIPSDRSPTINDSSNIEHVKPSVVYDVASLILYRCQALPIRLKIALDRLFSALTHEEVLQLLHGFGWNYEDYSRGYMLQVRKLSSNVYV